jgi:hypothetical protein
MDPEIHSLSVDHGIAGDEVVINGAYFGVKKPKVYLVDPTNGKKRNCKISQWEPMNTTTGASQLTFIVPKRITPSPLVPYILKLSNKVGTAETDFYIDF